MAHKSKSKRKLIIGIRNTFYGLIAIAVFSLIYIFQIEPLWFEIVPVNLTISNLAPAFDGFKIVQISDLHADTSMNPKKLSKIVDLINQQQPDLVAMTGDFVTSNAVVSGSLTVGGNVLITNLNLDNL